MSNNVEIPEEQLNEDGALPYMIRTQLENDLEKIEAQLSDLIGRKIAIKAFLEKRT